MNAQERFGIDPWRGHAERPLAIAYAPGTAREGMTALLALDATLAMIVARATDPMIAQLRLTWWHDALTALDSTEPPAQPVLRALANDVVARGVPGSALATMIDGWEALLEAEPSLDQFAEGRGRLFAMLSTLAGASDVVNDAGGGWALADWFASPPPRHEALAPVALDGARALLKQRRWSRLGRGIGALATSARMDLDAASGPGSPGRIARLLRLRLTGR